MVYQLFSYTPSEKMEFKLIALLPNDRGEGKDTVYITLRIVTKREIQASVG